MIAFDDRSRDGDGSPSGTLEHELRSVLPQGAARLDELCCGIYSRDASCYQYRPRAVVRVSSIDEVADLLAIVRKLRVPLTFRAAGTSLSGQTLGSGVVADLRLAWKGLEVRDGGMSVWVEPGVTVARVNEALAPLGRKLGPDPESAAAAMIGGVLANNSGGQQSGVEQDPYSTLRSLEFVLANGRRYDTAIVADRRRFAIDEQAIATGLTALRDRVRANPTLVERIRNKYRIKNVMGYSIRSFLDADDPIDILARLLVGSEGTLAFIASASLATVPLHPNWASGLLFFADIARSVEAADALLDDGASTVELMDRACIDTWREKPGAPDFVKGLSGEAAALLIEYRAASPLELDERLESARRLISDFDVAAGEFFTRDSATRERWLALRSAMYPLAAATRPIGSTVVIEDVAVPRDRLVELVLGLRTLFDRYGKSKAAFIFGHLAAGNVHFITCEHLGSKAGVKQFGLFIEDLVQLVLALDGSLKAEHGTGRAMAPFLAREWGDEAVAVMGEVKRLLDPEGVLNPGVLLNDDPRGHLHNIKQSPPFGDDVIDRCVECGFCERVCPTRAFTLTPRQRIVACRVALGLEQNDASAADAIWNEYAFEGQDTCVTDGLCGTTCPVEINVADLVDHQRAQKHGRAIEQAMNLAALHFGLAEDILRQAITLACAVDRLGPPVVSRATIAAKAVVPGMPQWSRSITKAPPRLYRECSNPAIVYFPSCISRMMGSSSSGDSVLAAVMRVADRAGIAVRLPPDARGLCCGQIWQHKGFRAGHATMANRLVEALWRWSDAGRLPVMCDVTSCTRSMLEELERERYGSRETLLSPANRLRHRALRILDLTEWLHDEVMDRLEIRRRKRSVLIHPTCACTQLNLIDMLTGIVARCAEEWTIPSSLGCCGAGGDRGLIYPRLADAAMRDEANETRGRTYDGAYSFARTCEIVLSDRTGRPWESLVYLVDQVTT